MPTSGKLGITPFQRGDNVEAGTEVAAWHPTKI